MTIEEFYSRTGINNAVELAERIDLSPQAVRDVLKRPSPSKRFVEAMFFAFPHFQIRVSKEGWELIHDSEAEPQETYGGGYDVKTFPTPELIGIIAHHQIAVAGVVALGSDRIDVTHKPDKGTVQFSLPRDPNWGFTVPAHTLEKLNELLP